MSISNSRDVIQNYSFPSGPQCPLPERHPVGPVAAQVREGVEEGHVGAAHGLVADAGEERHHAHKHAVGGHLRGHQGGTEAIRWPIWICELVFSYNITRPYRKI